MDGSLYIPAPGERIAPPESLWLGLGGEPLILLMPLDARVDPPPAQAPSTPQVDEVDARAKAAAWAMAHARPDDYGMAYEVTLAAYRAGIEPDIRDVHAAWVAEEYGSGRTINVSREDDSLTPIDVAQAQITDLAAPGSDDLSGIYMGRHITLAAVLRVAPRWGVDHGHGKDGSWRRPLDREYALVQTVGQAGFRGARFDASGVSI